MADDDPHPPTGAPAGTAVPPTPEARSAWTRAAEGPAPDTAARPPEGDPRSEPAIDLPWPVALTAAALAAAFLAQLAGGTEAVIMRFGLVPIALSAGRAEGLLSHIFLHGGWLHLVLNTTALLAFGAPVARWFGSGMGGAGRFLLYFLICGVIGGLTFWALHPDGATPLVGASGAVSGLMGGAARLVERRGRLGAPLSRAALGFVVPWVVLNLLIAVAGLALGPAMPIAWEAHLGGLAAGLLLIGPFSPRRRKP